MNSIISLLQSSALLFPFKISNNSTPMTLMSPALHPVFLLTVTIKNLVRMFQELVHTLHPATCYDSTKAQTGLKLFHLPHHLGLMFYIWLTMKASLLFFSFFATVDFKQVYFLTDSATQSKHAYLNRQSNIVFLFFCLSFLIRFNILYSYIKHETYPLKLLVEQTGHNLDKVIRFPPLYFDMFCRSIEEMT